MLWRAIVAQRRRLVADAPLAPPADPGTNDRHCRGSPAGRTRMLHEVVPEDIYHVSSSRSKERERS